MYTELYNKKDHEYYCKSWLKARNLDEKLADELPNLGTVVLERGEPIAMGFLRMCEGKYAIVDSLISNPEAPGDMRYSALDMVVDNLTVYSRDHDIKYLIAWTQDHNTRMRAFAHGFNQLEHTLISKQI